MYGCRSIVSTCGRGTCRVQPRQIAAFSMRCRLFQQLFGALVLAALVGLQPIHQLRAGESFLTSLPGYEGQSKMPNMKASRMPSPAATVVW